MTEYAITQASIDSGQYAGAWTGTPGGKNQPKAAVHPLVLPPGRNVLYTVCGIEMRGRGSLVTDFSEPVIFNCRNCIYRLEKAARQNLVVSVLVGSHVKSHQGGDEPQAPVPGEPEKPRQDYDALRLDYDTAVSALAILRSDYGKVRAALDEGLANWRVTRAAMRGEITGLQRRTQQLEAELAEARAGARVPKSRRALADSEAAYRRTAGQWRGLAGILLWQLGGAGSWQKSVTLDPVSWAAAVGQLVTVTMKAEGEGSVTVTASLNVPAGPADVPE